MDEGSKFQKKQTKAESKEKRRVTYFALLPLSVSHDVVKICATVCLRYMESQSLRELSPRKVD